MTISLRTARWIFVSSVLTLFVCSPTSGQLKVALATDKRAYGYGESITVTCTVTNNADTAVTIWQPWQGPLTRTTFDSVPIDWILLPTSITYTYASHASRTWALKLDMTQLGLPNKQGTHTIVCYYSGDTIFGKDSLTIEQPIFYGGQVEVSFSIAMPTAQIQALRDSMHASIVTSQSYGQTVIERWNTSGFILDSLVAKYSGDGRLQSIQAYRMISGPTTQVAKVPTEIRQCELFQNYPNPFNPRCAIEYQVDSPQSITISVCDELGRLVIRQSKFVSSSARQTIVFEGSSLPSGLYLYRLETASRTLVRKMLLLK